MIKFLTLSNILTILENQISNYGGMYGIRDLSLLNSALAMPQSCFEGEYLHKGIPCMAAAYAYHICQNHPFVDGNKRTALVSSLVFLDINGYELECSEKKMYNTLISVANSAINKEQLIKLYEKNARVVL